MRSNSHHSALSMRCCQLAVLSILPAVLLTAPLAAQETRHATFDRIEDVIGGWSPEQRLWVRGDIAVSDDQLNRLESWLAANGANWTIVLMNNADGQEYRAVDGRYFTDMDAVEFALGHGLANRTRFGEITHPRTGETSGAVFVLFLAERKFSYYGSDVHDRRGLGESQWIGNLDRPAVRAMRNGGRIIDAVKETVGSINNAVNGKILREEQAARESAEQQERIRKETERQLAELSVEIETTLPAVIEDVVERASSLRSAFPEAAESDLAQPPVDDWSARLIEQRAALNDSTISRTRQALNEIRNEINRHLDAFAAHESFNEMLDTAESNLLTLEKDRTGAAKTQADEVNLLLNDARTGHATGNLDFAEKIHRANELIREGTNAIRKENQRLEQLEERRNAVRRTLLVVGAALLVILVMILWLLNRKRRPWLRKAHALFEKRVAVASGEFDLTAALKHRAKEILGPEDSFAERGFNGMTGNLGDRSFGQLERVETFAVELKRSIAAAEELLHPPGAVAEAMNMFTSGRYIQCFEELSGRTLNARDQKGGSSWVTFEEFLSLFQSERAVSDAQLDEFEQCIETRESGLNELREKITLAEHLGRELTRAGRMDRKFDVASLEDSLIPAARDDMEMAIELSGSDPVRVLREIIPTGLQKIEDGSAVARTIQQMRKNIFPVLDKCSRDLKSKSFDTRWIKRRVDELADTADGLFLAAVEGPIGEEAASFDDETRQLADRAKKCVELSIEIADKAGPSLEELENSIIAARETISSRLNIALEDALHERDYDPAVELQQARRQLESAAAALNIGGVAACTEALEAVHIERTQANGLVEVTLELLDSFSERHAQIISARLQSLERVGPAERLIVEAARAYASTAMQFLMSDDRDEDGNPDTVETHLAFARKLLDEAEEATQQLKSVHDRGAILESAAMADNVQADIELSNGLLEEITEHCERLDRLAEDNRATAQSHAGSIAALAEEYTDNRTRQQTVSRFYELSQTWNDFKDRFESTKVEPDPFDDEDSLSEFGNSIVEIETALENDRRMFEAAKEAVATLNHQLASLSALLRQASDDRIPDSRSIHDSRERIQSLQSAVNQLANRIETPHEDWLEIETEASVLANECGLMAGTLRRELNAAQEAVREFQVAAAKVREATKWGPVFSHGVRIRHDHGQFKLRDAQDHLARGNYQQCIRNSKSAVALATSAITEADAELSRKVERERRRRERKRRQRQSAFSSGFGSSGRSRSSTSSGFSSGSSRRSSGFGGSRRSSSSGFGRSNSGFSRSGW